VAACHVVQEYVVESAVGWGVLAHPSQLHSQQRTLAQHDMLPQHPVYRNELTCECFNVTLAKKERSSLRMICGSKHVGAI